VTENPRQAYFDGIADQWDGWEDLDALSNRLASGLEELGIGADETVLDIGCGTGNLTRALLRRLSSAGRVVAVDLSPRMLEVARKKVTDPRVEWHAADAQQLPIGDESSDRVICCSVWPHFDHPEQVALELGRVLRPEGSLHVWHLGARARINAIHAGAGHAIRQDRLPPANETARLLSGSGFQLRVALENEERYLVTAVKPAP
jgi:demethylmenaquinone methyltransferase/2-methoxy-6-polyprenyl-1,4-benzoquinol methylase